MKLSSLVRVLLAGVIVVGAATLYLGSPFIAAWRLRDAIRQSDVATIEQKVQWDTVRATLKASLARQAQLQPEVNAASAAVKPTLWQRIKTGFGATMLDRFIENYVTPEGLPQLFSYRKAWKENVQGEPDEALTLPWHERFQRFLQRVRRAEFQSLSRVVLEVEDKSTAERRYRSVFELIGLEWKLTELEVLSSPGASMIETPAMRLSDVPAAAWRAAKDAAVPRPK
jgi:hypothetical protein